MKKQIKNILLMSLFSFGLVSCNLQVNNSTSNNFSQEVVSSSENSTQNSTVEESTSQNQSSNKSEETTSENESSSEEFSSEEISSSSSEDISFNSSTSDVCAHSDATIVEYIKNNCQENVVVLKSCGDCLTEFEEELDYVGSHIYDQKIEDNKYLAHEEKCTTYKEYFYSCICGLSGNEVFNVGSKDEINHKDIVEYVTVEPNYVYPGSGYYYCDNCQTRIDESHEIPCLDRITPEIPSVDTIDVSLGTHTSEIDLPEGFEVTEFYVLDEVGLTSLNVVYQVPNDYEYKYYSVNTSITINVVGFDFELEKYNYSSLETIQYSNQPISLEEIFDEKYKDLKIEIYDSENKLLNEYPSKIGEYKIKLIVNDKKYNDYLDEKIINVSIVKTNDISNMIETYKYYDGSEISFPLLSFINEDDINITYSFYSNSTLLPYVPSSLGVYQVNIKIEESELYEEIEYSFKYEIIEDEENPTFDSDYGEFINDPDVVFDFEDNNQIYFYRIEDELGNTTIIFDKEYTFPSYGRYYVHAYDYNGNYATKYYEYDGSNYNMELVYPLDGETVDSNIVYLYVENADYYYLSDADYSNSKSIDIVIKDGKRQAVLFVENNKTYYWSVSNSNNYEKYSFNVSYQTENENFSNPNYDNKEVTTREVLLEIDSNEKLNSFYYSSEEDGYFNNVTANYINDPGLMYGRTYYWYATDVKGNKSETYSFVYKYQEDAYSSLIEMENYQEVMYINQTSVTLSCFSVLDMTLRVLNASTNQMVSLSGNKNGNLNFANVSDLENNNTYYCYWVDYYGTIRSKFTTLIVDLDKPVVGEILDEGDCYSLIPGSDNLDATNYYRINSTQWIEFNDCVEIEKEDVFYIELKIVDCINNIDYVEYFISQNTLSPNIEVLEGKLDQFVNTNVSFVISPNSEAKYTYLYIGEEEYLITQEEIFTFERDVEVNMYTKVIDNNDNVYFSNNHKVLIDKTAPMIDGVNIEYNNEYTNTYYQLGYIYIDKTQIVDRNEVTLYYKMEGVDDEYCPFDERVNIGNYWIAETDEFDFVIKAVDSLGNESFKTIVLYNDGQAPTFEKFVVDRDIDNENKTTDYILKISGIRDDISYVKTLSLRVWDMKGYTSGADAIINIDVDNSDFNDYFEYDISSLEDGQIYYIRFALEDVFGNYFASSLYYLLKYNVTTAIDIDGYIFNYNNEEYTLINYQGEETDLVLPSEVNGKSYKVADNFMYANQTITSVYIPEGVTSIGVSAFYECPLLTSVYISDSVEVLGYEAFYNCDSLKEVRLSSGLTCFGDFAFYECEKIESVTIFDGVKYLGNENDPYIVVIGYINNEESEIVLHQDNLFIGARSFDSANITSLVTSEKLISIGYAAFYRALSLENITINGDIDTIPEFAFAECSSLKAVDIPSSVHSIYEGAFNSCSSLEELTLGSNIEYLGVRIIAACTNLKTIYYNIVTLEETDYSRYYSPFFIGESNVELTLVIGSEVKELPPYVFSDLQPLTEVLFEENSSLEIIHEYAFVGCNNLTDIIIPEGVKTIERYAIPSTGLLNVSIPNSIENVYVFFASDVINYTVENGAYYLGNDTNPYLVLCKVDDSVYKFEVNENTRFIIEFAISSDSLKELYIPSSVEYIYSFPNMSTNNGMLIVFEDKDNWYVNDVLIDKTRMDDMDYLREIYFDNFDTPWVKKEVL